MRLGSMCDAVVQSALALSGGCLTRTALLPTLSFQDRNFVQISRRNATLMRSLTGQRAKLSPMKGSPAFDPLVSARNEATRNLGKENPMREDLGLDEVSTPSSKRLQERQARKDSLISRSIVQIDFHGGHESEPFVLA